ncbi:MAG: hypothetical protein CMF25_04680 [Kangiellaceae bacterium]|nr:hypothetical protein [Kangiellaceae bacterium]|tara:strand:- start:2934 stop:3401 length:468 start_codon:yes stop_codon:yes gene_type:complete
MSAIADILHRQLNFTEALVKAIHQERQALSSFDTAKLEKVAKEKFHYLQQIDALEKRRIEACPTITEQLRQDSDFVDWLTSQENPDLLKGMWQQIKQNLAAIREENASNGKVIMLTHRSVEKGLRMLKGQTPESTTYTKNGYADNHVSSRTFATA